MDDDPSLPFNSCGDYCRAVLKCQHVCLEFCHPGPCGGCQSCERGIPRATLPRQRNVPRDSLELRRDWAPMVQHRNDQDIERADNGLTTRGHATSNGRPRTLPAATWVPLVVCLAVTAFMAGAIFGLTKVIVEPYNHRSIAENNHAMRAAWILLTFGALINGCTNMGSVTRVRELVDYCKQRISNTSFATTWTSWMRICVEVQFCWELTKFVAQYVFFCMVLAWILGSLAWYVKVRIRRCTTSADSGPSTFMIPLLARQAEFARVCDGFDTRILLDISESTVTRRLQN